MLEVGFINTQNDLVEDERGRVLELNTGKHVDFNRNIVGPEEVEFRPKYFIAPKKAKEYEEDYLGDELLANSEEENPEDNILTPDYEEEGLNKTVSNLLKEEGGILSDEDLLFDDLEEDKDDNTDLQNDPINSQKDKIDSKNNQNDSQNDQNNSESDESDPQNDKPNPKSEDSDSKGPIDLAINTEKGQLFRTPDDLFDHSFPLPDFKSGGEENTPPSESEGEEEEEEEEDEEEKEIEEALIK